MFRLETEIRSLVNIHSMLNLPHILYWFVLEIKGQILKGQCQIVDLRTP